jgi:hypothetical protein
MNLKQSLTHKEMTMNTRVEFPFELEITATVDCVVSAGYRATLTEPGQPDGLDDFGVWIKVGGEDVNIASALTKRQIERIRTMAFEEALTHDR